MNLNQVRASREETPDGHALPWLKLPWKRALLLGCLSLFPPLPRAAAQLSALPLGGTSGNVVASVKYGNTLYVGGFFARAGDLTGNAAALSAASGELLPGLPRFHGAVHTIVADGRGGWFVSGEFTAVDGAPHGPLAHLDAEMKLLSWDPRPDDAVLALAVCGDTIVAGGRFLHVGAQARRHLAAFRRNEETPIANLAEPNNWVRALLVDGNRLYVGGDFDSVGSERRGAVVAFELERLELSSWRPQVAAPGVVTRTIRSFAKVGDDLLLGGRFNPSGGLGAVSTITGEFRLWSPQITGPDNMYYGPATVDAMVVEDTTVYLAGHFAWVSGIRRGGLAKVGYPSGILSPWNPDPGPWFGDENSDVKALYLQQGRLFIAGWFSTVGDSGRASLASVDTESGRVLPWNPGAGAPALAMAGQGDVIVTGGLFHGAGGEWSQDRRGLAAFDLSTGKLKSWNPQISGLGVNALAAHGGHIYVGGYFDGLGGQPRYCLGAVDTVAGDATNWDPACTGPVLVLRTIADTLYVGGGFGSLSGQPRSCIGAFEIGGGRLIDWAPVASDAVRAIERVGQQVLVGGDFYYFNGVRRPGLVSVDAATGTLNLFDCGITFPAISALVASGDTLFAGGVILGIRGQPRQNVAAVDVNTGSDLGLSAEPAGAVTGLVKIDSVLYVSGTFGLVSGTHRQGLAALSSSTGSLLDWNPGLNGTVWGLSACDRTLFAGGGFNEGLGDVRSSLIGIRLDALQPPAPEPIPRAVALSLPWPNPATDHAQLELALPNADVVSLAVFDLQGRQVLPVLERAPLPAGRHTVSLPVERLAKGFYVCRMRTAVGTAAQKLMVFR